MFTFLVLVIHIIVCLALILIILLQSGKGADIGAVFGGGGGGTVFGPSGAATFLSKITIVAAVVFMITSVLLSYFSSAKLPASDRSVIGTQSEPARPSDTGMPQPGETKKEPPGAVPTPSSPPQADSAPKSEPPAKESTSAPQTQPSPSPAPPAEKN